MYSHRKYEFHKALVGVLLKVARFVAIQREKPLTINELNKDGDKLLCKSSKADVT